MKPSMRAVQTDHKLVYEIAGEWTSDYAELCLSETGTIKLDQGQNGAITCGGVERVDITGAWILNRKVEELKKAGFTLCFEHFQPEHARFIEHIGAIENQKHQFTVEDVPLSVGHWLTKQKKNMTEILVFLGWCWYLIFYSLIHPKTFRSRAFIKQCDVAAVRATPIVGIISFLIAIVLDYQGAAQLKRFGAEIFSVNLVTISVLREMGSLLTAIMVAGRSGSAFAAEIGAMKLDEEVDALTTTGLQPMEILVLPRVIALTLMLPLLTFLADMTGLLGAGVLTTLTSKTSWLLFTSRLLDAIKMTDFWIGIGKAPVFGFAIALVGCYHGMKVTNSAESVGKETTNAVVNSIFLVMILDAIFSILFTTMGL